MNCTTNASVSLPTTCCQIDLLTSRFWIFSLRDPLQQLLRSLPSSITLVPTKRPNIDFMVRSKRLNPSKLSTLRSSIASSRSLSACLHPSRLYFHATSDLGLRPSSLIFLHGCRLGQWWDAMYTYLADQRRSGETMRMNGNPKDGFLMQTILTVRWTGRCKKGLLCLVGEAGRVKGKI